MCVMQYPGAHYHVMKRGRRRENFFLDSSDYQAFVDMLASVSDMFNAQVSPSPRWSTINICCCARWKQHQPHLRYFDGIYIQCFNYRHGVWRPAFPLALQGPTGGSERILLGPGFELGRLTSHHGYASERSVWNWLHRTPLLRRFSDNLDEVRGMCGSWRRRATTKRWSRRSRWRVCRPFLADWTLWRRSSGGSSRISDSRVLTAGDVEFSMRYDELRPGYYIM